MAKFHAICDALHRVFSSRYVLYLESEVKRLRNENTLLLYSRANLPVVHDSVSGSARVDGATAKAATLPINRRHSWQQLNRQKEAGIVNEDRDFKAQENARVVAETTARAAKEAAEAMEKFGQKALQMEKVRA